jgi:hypothetical protein
LQIKIIIYQYISITAAEIQNTDTTNCWWGCAVTGTLTYRWLAEMHDALATVEDTWAVS